MKGKKYQRPLIAAAVVILLLAAAFFAGGSLPEDDTANGGSDLVTELPQEPQGTQPEAQPEQAEPSAPADQTATEPAQEPDASQREDEKPVEQEPAEPPAETPPPAEKTDTEAGKDQYQTDPVPEGKPAPVEPENTQVTETAYTCTISISCATILDNLEDLDPEKTELVPEDGWLLEPITATFYEGESVFDVLQRVCREQKIHMEFVDTPMYNSAYIEGIGNLYEFDCGNLSGWMYCVNEWFPNYGCSRYALQNGDVIRWVYTCDLGADVGDNSMTGA